MSVDQLPARIREFVNYLDGLLARLDQGGGWCGVFWQRDPEGMHACLDGRELPPWDVVESLLHDLAAQYGPGGTGPETERARALHAGALAAYDARPGGRDALEDRLDVMLREQRYAAERQAELGRLLASAAGQEEADAIRLDLAWARDDHERATARCAELRARMADLDRRAATGHGQAIRRDRAGEGGVFRLDDRFEGDRFGDDRFERDDSEGDRLGADRFEGDRFEDDRFGNDAFRRDDFRGTGPWANRTQPSEAASSGGGFAGTPHRSDARSAAEAAGRTGEQENAPAGPAGGPTGRGAPAGRTADRHEGRRAVASAAEAAEWRAAQRASGAQAAERHDARTGEPAHSFADGGAAAMSDWPDPRHPGATGAAHPAGHPTDRTAPAGAAATPEWAKAQAGDRRLDGPSSPGAPAPTTPGDRAPTPPATAEPSPTPKQRKRRRGSARFAGMVEEEAAPVVVPPTAAPTLPAQPATTRRTLRGARFAGAAAEKPAPAPTVPQPQAQPLDAADRREVVGTVETLVRLRGEGRSGEAHALLVEVAYWPAARFPLLAAEMQRARLGADWATLLWEAASLPAERLVAAADALTAAGRADDGEQILRQGVARPANEIGQAVVGLVGAGRHRGVRALLDAYVRVRTPEEAARSAAADPGTLVPLLLEAAQGVSDERHWDLVHALRVAGFAA
ncbi:hypothetical protein J7F01_04305 [Streptomyces sp. ISL-22]|uniref:hypothetical protein n=1 Tax=unclassified Streptomyces TaxID=2593676 RepID=UPI001BECCE81|nr:MULTISPECIES: hypothetical protein [unclassified Streptomyces]MBT2418814.1 hypothetical protein [Streptomyces sp. ISL-24]MBT2431439.1 hypothetical protein [Streptomyces sp. ISL-22]